LLRKIRSFSIEDVNNNSIFNKICLDLLNDMAESEAKHNQLYQKQNKFYKK